MLKASLRGAQMPDSPISNLDSLAQAVSNSGVTVHYLNIGQPDMPTANQALTALAGYSDVVHPYCPPSGLQATRDAFIALYGRKGFSLQPNNLVITAGASEALWFAMLACLDHGDELIVPEPFYTNYNAFAIAAGVRIVPVTGSISNGFALPPISDFEAKLSARTKAILLCNPNNPTGYAYTQEELLLLKNFVQQHGLFLITDEVYHNYVYRPNRHHSVLELDGMDEHAVLCDSTSKSYSTAGFRVGALISRNPQVMRSVRKLAEARLSASFIGQVAASGALAVAQEELDRINHEYTQRRNYVIDRLQQMPGVSVSLPKGSFCIMAKLPVADSAHFAQWMLAELRHKGQTLVVNPAAGFYASPNLGKDEIRMVYVKPLAVLEQAMDVLQHALVQYAQHH